MTPFIRLAQNEALHQAHTNGARDEARQGEATSAAAGLAVGQVEQPRGPRCGGGWVGL